MVPLLRSVTSTITPWFDENDMKAPELSFSMEEAFEHELRKYIVPGSEVVDPLILI